MKYAPAWSTFQHGRMAMDFLKFYPGPPCPSLVHPVAGPPLKRPHSLTAFRGGPPVGRAACGCLLPLWTPHAVRLCFVRWVCFRFLWSSVAGIHLCPTNKIYTNRRHRFFYFSDNQIANGQNITKSNSVGKRSDWLAAWVSLSPSFLPPFFLLLLGYELLSSDARP
jgi:hypothetical protein